MENNNNSSNSLVFGRWPQTKIQHVPFCQKCLTSNYQRERRTHLKTTIHPFQPPKRFLPLSHCLCNHYCVCDLMAQLNTKLDPYRAILGLSLSRFLQIVSFLSKLLDVSIKTRGGRIFFPTPEHSSAGNLFGSKHVRLVDRLNNLQSFKFVEFTSLKRMVNQDHP